MKVFELKRLLRQHGWVVARRGNHTIYVKDGVDGVLSVPNHVGDLKKGTVNSILKAAGIDVRA